MRQTVSTWRVKILSGRGWEEAEKVTKRWQMKQCRVNEKVWDWENESIRMKERAGKKMREHRRWWLSITVGTPTALRGDMSDYRECLNTVDQCLVSPLPAPLLNDGCCLAALGYLGPQRWRWISLTCDEVYIANPSARVRRRHLDRNSGPER